MTDPALPLDQVPPAGPTGSAAIAPTIPAKRASGYRGHTWVADTRVQIHTRGMPVLSTNISTDTKSRGEKVSSGLPLVQRDICIPPGKCFCQCGIVRKTVTYFVTPGKPIYG